MTNARESLRRSTVLSHPADILRLGNTVSYETWSHVDSGIYVRSAVHLPITARAEDLCNASQCPDPDVYEVVRNCIFELVDAFGSTEDDDQMTMEKTMEEWLERKVRARDCFASRVWRVMSAAEW